MQSVRTSIMRTVKSLSSLSTLAVGSTLSGTAVAFSPPLSNVQSQSLLTLHQAAPDLPPESTMTTLAASTAAFLPSAVPKAPAFADRAVLLGQQPPTTTTEFERDLVAQQDLPQLVPLTKSLRNRLVSKK